MNNNEKWCVVKEYPDYLVSDLGNIKDTVTGCMCSLSYVCGYLKVYIRDKQDAVRVHRLVAIAFCSGRTEERNIVNHIDGVKDNNVSSNLEWCTDAENAQHAIASGLRISNTKLTVIDLNKGSNGIKDRSGVYPSIKSFATLISMRAQNLIGYVKYSKEYPFLGRYVMSVPRFNGVADTRSSESVYVYDLIDDTHRAYPNANSAALHTGIKSLCNLTPNRSINVAGYVVSKSKLKDLSKFETCTMEERMEYMSRPYKRRPISYVLHDYATEEDIGFSNIGLLLNKLKEVTKQYDIPNKVLINVMSDARRVNRTGLILGYGVSALYEGDTSIPWTTYPPSYLLNSVLGRKQYLPVYIVNNNGVKIHQPVSLVQLVVILKDYLSDRIFQLDKTHLSVELLNKETPDSITITKMNNKFK